MRYIYVAGPFSKGSNAANTHEAYRAADALLGAGLFPFVPHASLLWEAISPKPYETWMALDFAWLRKCDAVLRLPGESHGADREVAEAHRLGLPVFRDLGDLLQRSMLLRDAK